MSENKELTPEQLKAMEIEAKRIVRNAAEFAQSLENLVNMLSIAAIYLDDFRLLEYHQDIADLGNKRTKKHKTTLKADVGELRGAFNTFFRMLREKSPTTFSGIMDDIVGDKKHDINLIFSKVIKMTPENLRNIITEMEEIQAGRVKIETVQIEPR